MSDRCTNCDRETCKRDEPTRELWETMDATARRQFWIDAHAHRVKCDRNTVNWRERAMAAEAKLSRLSQLAGNWAARGGYARGVFAKDLRNVLAGTVGGGPNTQGGDNGQ